VNVQVTGGDSGIPAGASAAIINVTVVNSSATAGFYRAYPAGGTLPIGGFHYAAGINTTMQSQVALSSMGQITLTNSNTTADIVIDVQGYFTATGGGGSVFTPGIGRPFDSRASASFAPNEIRSIQIAGAAGVPVMGSGVTAVVLTLISLGTDSGTGRAIVWPHVRRSRPRRLLVSERTHYGPTRSPCRSVPTAASTFNTLEPRRITSSTSKGGMPIRLLRRLPAHSPTRPVRGPTRFHPLQSTAR
jgi:hypothetical protein